jgi:3',5'-cyclic AMP phosphodiesterase CpdA
MASVRIKVILACVALALLFGMAFASDDHHTLRFKADGTFKIVQFTDTQDGTKIEPRTVQLINKVLDTEKPDLVVFTGDNINGSPKSAREVRLAIDNWASLVDRRSIPWFALFGNHDEDSMPQTGVDEKAMLEMYMSYRYNINQPGPSDVNGTGNMNVLIYGSRSPKPIFGVWGLDSGRYAPDKLAGQKIGDDFLLGWGWMPTWDWIRPSQIEWYTQTSQYNEQRFHEKVPSLMFFHIPLQEWRTMFENGKRHQLEGYRFEDECPGPFNSGLLAALQERGDVKGVFVGHDHVNNYTGNYFGIRLGYSANTGFGTYGLCSPGSDPLPCTDNLKNAMRGARVFTLKEGDPANFGTHMVYASDKQIGIIEPVKLP